MNSYFLTYNPDKGDFTDYPRAVRLTSQGQPYPDDWSVRSSKIDPGDRVFVLRQGRLRPGLPAKGIIAEGFVTKGSYNSTANRDGTGGDSDRVDIELRTVLGPDEKPLSWPLPGREYTGKFKGPRKSGVLVPSDIAGEIEAWWAAKIVKAQVKSEDHATHGFDLSAALSETPEQAIQDIKKRRGQSEFRAQLLKAYDNRCALSDCDVVDALEAAHIVPHSGRASDHVQNGILLRADLHTLFDSDLFLVDPETLKAVIRPALEGTAYAWLSDRCVKPARPEWRPSAEALRHRAQTPLRNSDQC